MALDLVAMTALQAYIERVFSVCSDMYPGKHNIMSIIFIMKSYTKYDAGTARFSVHEQEILGKSRHTAAG